MRYCKLTFNPSREILMRFAKALLSRIFLPATSICQILWNHLDSCGPTFVECEVFAFTWGCNFTEASVSIFSKKTSSFIVCFPLRMKICGLGLPTYITKIDPPQNLMIPKSCY